MHLSCPRCHHPLFATGLCSNGVCEAARALASATAATAATAPARPPAAAAAAAGTMAPVASTTTAATAPASVPATGAAGAMALFDFGRSMSLSRGAGGAGGATVALPPMPSYERKHAPAPPLFGAFSGMPMFGAKGMGGMGGSSAMGGMGAMGGQGSGSGTAAAAAAAADDDNPTPAAAAAAVAPMVLTLDHVRLGRATLERYWRYNQMPRQPDYFSMLFNDNWLLFGCGPTQNLYLSVAVYCAEATAQMEQWEIGTVDAARGLSLTTLERIRAEQVAHQKERIELVSNRWIKLPYSKKVIKIRYNADGSIAGMSFKDRDFLDPEQLAFFQQFRASSLWIGNISRAKATAGARKLDAALLDIYEEPDADADAPPATAATAAAAAATTGSAAAAAAAGTSLVPAAHAGGGGGGGGQLRLSRKGHRGLIKYAVRRASKFLMRNQTVTDGGAIYYALDGLDLLRAARAEAWATSPKFPDELSVPICTSELREAFRYWNHYEHHIYFFHDFLMTYPPWDRRCSALVAADATIAAWGEYAAYRALKVLTHANPIGSDAAHFRASVAAAASRDWETAIAEYHAGLPSNYFAGGDFGLYL